MIVTDIESTGMDPKKNSIVSIGAVEFENPGNRFYGECKVEEGLEIDPVSLQINGFSLHEIMDPKKPTGNELLGKFFEWVKGIEERTLAGDNIWFDTGFMKEKSKKFGLKWPFQGKAVELHEVSLLTEGVPWSLDLILRIIGIPERKGSHNALNDALLTAEAISRLALGKGRVKKYQKYPVPDFIREFVEITKKKK